MTKASLSFFILLFAALMTSFDSQAEVIRERIQVTLSRGERMDLPYLLRLSRMEGRELEVRSITVVASSFVERGRLEILLDGRSTIAPQPLSRVPRQIRLSPPRGMTLDRFELEGRGREVFIESISVDVERRFTIPRPGPRPRPLPHPMPRPRPGRRP